MRGVGSAERTDLRLVALVLCGLLASPLRADPSADAVPSGSGIPRAAELAIVRYKRAALELQRFDQAFPLTGRLASEAIQSLREGGYACAVDPQAASRRTSPAARVAPGVVCERPSIAADDICRARIVIVSVDGQDPRDSSDGLAAQLGSRRVSERAFRCE